MIWSAFMSHKIRDRPPWGAPQRRNVFFFFYLLCLPSQNMQLWVLRSKDREREREKEIILVVLPALDQPDEAPATQHDGSLWPPPWHNVPVGWWRRKHFKAIGITEVAAVSVALRTGRGRGKGHILVNHAPSGGFRLESRLCVRACMCVCLHVCVCVCKCARAGGLRILWVFGQGSSPARFVC